jgi:hypothetical protein
MSTPPSKLQTGGWEHVVYTLFVALGTYLGVWLGPSIHEWKSSAPDLYGAIAGMGIGFVLGSIANGFIAGVREGRGRK